LKDTMKKGLPAAILTAHFKGNEASAYTSLAGLPGG